MKRLIFFICIFATLSVNGQMKQYYQRGKAQSVDLSAGIGTNQLVRITDTVTGGMDFQATRTIPFGTNIRSAIASGWLVRSNASGGSGGSMTWPSGGAGIPKYNGSFGWGTTITDNSANWNTAHGWGNHANAGYFISPMARYGSMIWQGNSGAEELNIGTEGQVLMGFLVGGRVTPSWRTFTGSAAYDTNNNPWIFSDYTLHNIKQRFSGNVGIGSATSFIHKVAIVGGNTTTRFMLNITDETWNKKRGTGIGMPGYDTIECVDTSSVSLKFSKGGRPLLRMIGRGPEELFLSNDTAGKFWFLNNTHVFGAYTFTINQTTSLSAKAPLSLPQFTTKIGVGVSATTATVQVQQATDDSLLQLYNSRYGGNYFTIGKKGSVTIYRDIYMANKARNAVQSFMTRDSTGTVATMNLLNLGDVSLKSGGKIYLGGNSTVPSMTLSSTMVLFSGGIKTGGYSDIGCYGLTSCGYMTGCTSAYVAGGAGSGTNSNGNVSYMRPGATTGTGYNWTALQRYGRGTSGSSANTAYDAVLVMSEKNFTYNTIDTLFQIVLTDLQTTGGQINYTVAVIHDGTADSVQSLSGTLTYSATMIGTTLVSQLNNVPGTAAVNPAGSTLSGTFTCTKPAASGSYVTINYTPSTSITNKLAAPAMTTKMMYTLFNNSRSAITQK